MRDFETENLLRKYFTDDTHNNCEEYSFEFEPFTFTSVGEVKEWTFIPKLSGKVKITVSNNTTLSHPIRFYINIFNDEGTELVKNLYLNVSDVRAFILNVSAFHKYTLSLKCSSIGEGVKYAPECSFMARVRTKTEAYVIK